MILSKRVFHPIYYNNILYRCSKAYKREVQLVAFLHKFSNDVIRKRKEYLQAKAGEDDEIDGGSRRKFVFLDLLLRAKMDGMPLNDEEIREEVDAFMFAGHDTSTSVISFTLLNIAKYPEVQRNVFEECQEILKGRKLATMEDLKKMKYLENVIKESLRLYPPVRIF